MIKEIRRASAADADAILELLSEVLEVHHAARPDIFKGGATKYTRRELSVLLTDDARPVYVATGEGGGILGYVFCVHVCHEDDNILTPIKTLYIDDLCVAERYRGEGVGRALYDYAVAYARSEGFYNLTLNVWADNAGAVAFYERLGLRPQKIGMELILKDEKNR